MAVSAKSQKLKICISKGFYQLIIPSALLLRILCQTAGHICILREDINMVKQIFLHEIAVALVVVSGKSLILIQVHGVYFLKAEIPSLVPCCKLFVCSNGCRTGCQAQNAVRTTDHLSRNNVRCTTAHGVVVLFTVYSHNFSVSFPYTYSIPIQDVFHKGLYHIFTPVSSETGRHFHNNSKPHIFL